MAGSYAPPPPGAEASLTDRRHAARAAVRRHPANPSPAKPSSISAQVEGSGAGVVPLVVTSRMSLSPTAKVSPFTFTVIESAVKARAPGRAGPKSEELEESTVTFVMLGAPVKVKT